MGVDWITCKNCGENFPDCGPHVYCGGCGAHWCSDECAEEDGYIAVYDEDDNHEDEEDSCKYCRKEDFDDDELLEYALYCLKMTRSQLIQCKKECDIEDMEEKEEN